MQAGKLENKTLSKMLDKIKNDNSVIVGAKVGVDCSVVNMTGENLVITSDPITSVVDNISALAIDINLNDLYAGGAEPIGVTVTAMFPTTSTMEEIEEVFDELVKTCEEKKINLLGGHTEITDAVIRPILSVTAVGKTDKYSNNQYTPKFDDEIIITKGYAIEGSLILGKYYYDEIIKFVNKNKLDNYLKYCSENLSVKEESYIGRKYNTVMHDVTEGGVFGGIFEVLEGYSLGCDIKINSNAVNEVTATICEIYNISPFKLISSGTMIIIVDSYDSDALKNELKSNGIDYFVLGKVTNDSKKCILDGMSMILENNEKDELYKVM